MSLQDSHLRTQIAGSARKFNVDLLAITIALTLAALIRLNIIPHISF
jgi:hypothetical protein